MNEKNRLIKNTGIIAIGNISTKLVSFLLLPLYTSLLTKTEYGIVDYIASISVFLIPCISVLMDESLFRFLIDCKTDKERTKVISISIVVILTGLFVFVTVAVPILLLIDYQYSLFVILYVVTSAVSTMISALLRGIGRTDKYAVYHFLVSSSTITMNVIFIAGLHMKVEGILLSTIISHIVWPTIYIIRLKLWKYVDFKSLDKQLAKEMLRYSFPLIPNKLSWSIINVSDRLMIMNMMGADFSGLYAVSYKFPTLMDTIYGFFYQSWKESTARVLKEKNRDEFYNSIYSYLKDFMYSVSIGMIAFMPLAFHFFVNSNFKDAILYVPCLLMGTYFANISGFYGGIFTSNKNTKIMGISTVYAAVINIVINLIFIRLIGLYAAALSTFFANFLVYLYRKAKVKQYVVLKENAIKSIIAIVVLAAVIVLFYQQNTAATVISCVIASVYALITNKTLICKCIEMVLKRKLKVNHNDN